MAKLTQAATLIGATTVEIDALARAAWRARGTPADCYGLVLLLARLVVDDGGWDAPIVILRDLRALLGLG